VLRNCFGSAWRVLLMPSELRITNVSICFRCDCCITNCLINLYLSHLVFVRSAVNSFRFRFCSHYENISGLALLSLRASASAAVAYGQWSFDDRSLNYYSPTISHSRYSACTTNIADWLLSIRRKLAHYSSFLDTIIFQERRLTVNYFTLKTYQRLDQILFYFICVS